MTSSRIKPVLRKDKARLDVSPCRMKQRPIFLSHKWGFCQLVDGFTVACRIVHNVPRLSTSARLVTIRLQFKNNFQYSPIFSDRHYFRAFCLTDVVRSGLLMKFDYSYLNILILLVCTTQSSRMILRQFFSQYSSNASYFNCLKVSALYC